MSILVNWLESLHEEINISTKCSRVRNRKSTCSFCLEKCEQEAFELKDNLLIIDTTKCSMCGECIIACPMSAIEGIAFNRIFDKGSLVYDPSYTPAIKELLIYKKRGMTSIQVTHQTMNIAWETVVGDTNEQLRLLDESPIIVVEKVMDEVLSRRAFFGSFRKEGKQLAKSMAPAAWKIEKDDWKLSKYYPDSQFFSVKLDKDKCTLCQACFSLCPEEVFHLKESNLQIVNQKCVNCSSCSDVCPENAIEIELEIKSKCELVEILHKKDCLNCGHTFYSYYSETEKCHVCVNRNPEWLSPY
jgi:Fe-S-cluster-containing hydrogenase component 2